MIYYLSIQTLIVVIVLTILTIFLLIFYKIKIDSEEIKLLRYNVIDNKVSKVDFTEEYQGIKIIFFSDLHLGKTMKKEQLKNKIAFLKDLDADIYVFGGDLIGNDINKYYSIEDIQECFLPLIDKVKLAVYGNHDVREEKNLTFALKKEYLKASNFTFLNNEMYIYSKNKTQIKFYGLFDNVYHKLTNTIEDCDILISHTGDSIDEINSKFKLMLSGHTHGGQIRLPLLPWFYKPIKGKKYTAGYYLIKNKNLIISKGLGFNTIKVRFFAPSDIIIIDYR